MTLIERIMQRLKEACRPSAKPLCWGLIFFAVIWQEYVVLWNPYFNSFVEETKIDRSTSRPDRI